MQPSATMSYLKQHAPGGRGRSQVGAVDANDRAIASQSLAEENKAVRDYGGRVKRASHPGLKRALKHARGEEKQHAASFRSYVRSQGGPSIYTGTQRGAA